MADSQTPTTTPRSSPIGVLALHTLISASVFSFLFFLFSLLSSWQSHDNVGLFVVPLLIGFGVTAVPHVYGAVLRRLSFRLAVLGSIVALAVYSVAAGGLVTALARVPIADVGVLWHLATAALWGLLAAAVGAFWPGAVAPGDGPAQVDPDLSDEEWERQAAAELRGRGDMTDAHVRDLLAQAREQASTDGARLVSAFGAPAEYAVQPAPQRGIAPRRRALLYTAITAFPVFHLAWHVAEDGWTWDVRVGWAGVWLIAAGTAAILEWRTALQDGSSDSRQRRAGGGRVPTTARVSPGDS